MKKVLKIFIIIGIIIVIAAGAIAITFAILNKEKTPITAENFRSIMKDNGYIIQDSTEQYHNLNMEYVEQSYIAMDGSHQIEFLVLSTEEQSNYVYNINKAEFEASKGSSSTYSDVSGSNHAKYSLTSNGKYYYISRIENTLVYVDVDAKYKDDVKEIVKELGY